jgi:hypothetical protein
LGCRARQFVHRRWRQSSQRPSVIEAQPVFNERGMCRFKPGRQHLRVDCPQVFAGASAQGAGEANQIVSRSRRAARPRRRRRVSGLGGRRLPDDLEFRLFRSAAGKPASDRADLPEFQGLSPILFGGLTLCQACAARCRRGWCDQGWCRRQRQEHHNCQEGSHRYPQPIRQSVLFCPGSPWDYRLILPAEPVPPLPLTHLGVEGSEPTPECQRLTVCQRNELGRKRRPS